MIKWLGKTNMPIIDYLINKIVNYIYVHHIERLMYLGNFMLLCKIHTKEVYFIEWTIDAYDLNKIFIKYNDNKAIFIIFIYC